MVERHLLKGRPAMYIHNGLYNSIPYRLSLQLKTMLQYPDVLWVMDRWYLSEYVYSILGAKDSTMDIALEQAEDIFGIHAHPHKYLLSGVDPDILRARRARSKEKEMPVDIETEIDMYNMLAKNNWTRFTGEDIATVVDRL